MKLLYIKSEFELINKPKWLDDFRAKYDEVPEFHVSLKRQTFIEDDQVDAVIKKAKELSQHFNPFDVAFAGKHIDASPRGTYIMIPALANATFTDFLKQAFETFSEFSKYVRPQYLQYDKFQKPHVTIGRRLSGEKLLQAKADLPDTVSFAAHISNITVYVFPHNVGDKYMDFIDQAEITKFELHKTK